jgi:1-deoxy-D-xylulose-5-phosphate synthase
VLKNAPPLFDLARRFEQQAKGMVVPATLFEKFGFNYIGPIDGHDLDSLIPTLRSLRDQPGPRLLHVITRKGQGYRKAEDDPVLYHGVSKFQPEAGLAPGKGGGRPTYTQVFGDWLCDMAAIDSRLVGITPAMREGSGLVRFEQAYPDRYFDVGIAEQHAVTFAAGLACEGLKPVVAIYSTFLQRGYDQLIHDVCLQNLPVIFALDRGGLVGADGATHHGAYDLSYLRCLPNIIVMTPSDEDECRQMLYTAFTLDTPTAIRYPRGSGPGVTPRTEMVALDLGRAEVRRSGRRVALLAFGSMLGVALALGDEIDATVVNMRFVKPLDTNRVIELARSHDLLVTLEENAIAGGAGSAVAEALAAAGVATGMLHLGLPDEFIDHGEQQQLLALAGLDLASVREAVAARLASLERA